MKTKRATHAEVIGVNHLSVDFRFLAFNAKIGDPVLSATGGASSNGQLQMLVESRQPFFQLLNQPAGKTLGFCNCQLAELRAAASDGAAVKSGTAYPQPDRVQLLRQALSLERRNIHNDQVLHVGRT